MSRIYVATAKTTKDLILQRAKEKQKWLKQFKAWAEAIAPLSDASHFPVRTFFDEVTLVGVPFAKDPGRNWKRVKLKDASIPVYTPARNTKAGRELSDQFRKLQCFDFKPVREKLKLERQFSSFNMLGASFFYDTGKKLAGITCHEEFKWDVPKGFKEITYGEYQTLVGSK